MKIYDWFDGPYPARVRIALAEKGLLDRVEFISVNLWTGEPVLELDDGTLIAECTAITQYLDALDGNPTLTGQTAKEKGLIHMMTKRAEIEFLDAVSVYFHHATPGLGAHVELYQNPEWGNRMRDKAIKGMHYFNRVLEQQPFVAGDIFSMADITVLGGMIFASLIKLAVPDECAALRAWHARMQERPSVREWREMVANNTPRA
jgi:glutathione S-transferase